MLCRTATEILYFKNHTAPQPRNVYAPRGDYSELIKQHTAQFSTFRDQICLTYMEKAEKHEYGRRWAESANIRYDLLSSQSNNQRATNLLTEPMTFKCG